MNTTSLKTFAVRHKFFLLAVVIVLMSYGIAQFIIHEKFAALRADMQLHISEQETLLTTIAETTARNGVDAVTESVVKDCDINERTEFDTLLGRLDAGLQMTELTTLERLFGRCGGFFAQQKALMTARLQRETEIYEDVVGRFEIIAGGKASDGYHLDLWLQLGEAEKKQSELFTELVHLQDEIITALLAGKRTDSEELKTLMQQAQDTQQSLIVASKQAADIRAQLLPL